MCPFSFVGSVVHCVQNVYVIKSPKPERPRFHKNHVYLLLVQ